MGDLIDSYHPSLCVVSGLEERRGTQRSASTLVLNPGLLAEGSAAWLDWNLPADRQVDFLNLRDLAMVGAGTDLGECD